MIFTVLGAVAELERSLIVERVKAGIRNARAKGKKLGRPRAEVRESQIEALRASGASWRAIVKEMGGWGRNGPPNRTAAFQKCLRGLFRTAVWKCFMCKRIAANLIVIFSEEEASLCICASRSTCVNRKIGSGVNCATRASQFARVLRSNGTVPILGTLQDSEPRGCCSLLSGYNLAICLVTWTRNLCKVVPGLNGQLAR